MAMKAKYAFGNLNDVQSALDSGKIDAYDVLLLDGDTEPKIGWIDRNGNFRLVKSGADLSELRQELSTKVGSTELSELLSELEVQLETSIATKVGAEEVEAKLSTKADAAEVDKKLDKVATDSVSTAKAYTDEKFESALNNHFDDKKFEVINTPDGTLISFRDSEIRIMCPKNSVFEKQSVGVGGDPNCYYATLNTYVSDDNVVGYKERMGNQVDKEILTDLKTDKYGRKYQSTWLALARYDESTDTWNYYGKNSNKSRYIGWDYQIDFYDADGTIVTSNIVRINLSNEECHSINEPYYVGSMMKEIEDKLTEIETGYEIIEF